MTDVDDPRERSGAVAGADAIEGVLEDGAVTALRRYGATALGGGAFTLGMRRSSRLSTLAS